MCLGAVADNPLQQQWLKLVAAISLFRCQTVSSVVTAAGKEQASMIGADMSSIGKSAQECHRSLGQPSPHTCHVRPADWRNEVELYEVELM